MKAYKLPNGRVYQIVFKSIENKYYIMNLIHPEEVKSDLAIQEHWDFIEECETYQDALETLCLFARKRGDIVGLEKYAVEI